MWIKWVTNEIVDIQQINVWPHDKHALFHSLISLSISFFLLLFFIYFCTVPLSSAWYSCDLIHSAYFSSLWLRINSMATRDWRPLWKHAQYNPTTRTGQQIHPFLFFLPPSFFPLLVDGVLWKCDMFTRANNSSEREILCFYLSSLQSTLHTHLSLPLSPLPTLYRSTLFFFSYSTYSSSWSAFSFFLVFKPLDRSQWNYTIDVYPPSLSYLWILSTCIEIIDII